MAYKQLLKDYLTKTLGKTDEEVSEILFKKSDDGTLTEDLSETALEDLAEAHAEHLSAAPSDLLKAEFNKGHQAGKFEALSKEEEFIKKAYGLEGKGKLRDLIAEAASKASTLTEDKVLTHPAVVSRLAEKDAQIETIIAEKDTAIQEATTKADRQARFAKVAPSLDAALIAAGVSLESLKPAAKAAYLAQFEGKDFELTETGTYIKNADGTLQKDKHANPVKLEAFVASTAADWFPIEKQPGRQMPGNDPAPQPPGQSKWTKDNIPKSQQEFNEAYFKTLPADRPALFEAYEAAKQQ